jgi:hypothetical protein
MHEAHLATELVILEKKRRRKEGNFSLRSFNTLQKAGRHLDGPKQKCEAERLNKAPTAISKLTVNEV